METCEACRLSLIFMLNARGRTQSKLRKPGRLHKLNLFLWQGMVIVGLSKLLKVIYIKTTQADTAKLTSKMEF